MTADLTARIAETAAFIEEHLTADEAAAKACPYPDWCVDEHESYVVPAEANSYVAVGPWSGGLDEHDAAHIARNDPARVLRRVKAVRELAADIMGEGHEHNPLEEYYVCSQATAGAGVLNPPPEDLVPGSGCGDPERAGKPCDCGRDERVLRRLEIIASEWRDGA